MSDQFPYLDELDDYQRAAVTAPLGNVCVMAAPGAGKTRAMAARFMYMLDEHGIPPSEIVCLTFTNYAAQEMRSRIGSRASMAQISTFHAFALSLIKQYGRSRGWEPEWLTILDEDEAEMEEKQALQDLGLMNRKGRWVGCRGYHWRNFKEFMMAAGPYTGNYLLRLADRFTTAWNAFTNRLKAENCLTFDMLLLEAQRLLTSESTGPDIRKQYRHVIVDEGQDASQIEWDILEALVPHSLFVVADPDQAIYVFRGARPELMLKYGLREGTKVYQLPNSYRFGINIARPANALIEHNTDRIKMAIRAISHNDGKLEVIQGAPYEDIAGLIDEEIRKEDRRPRDIAVLARKHVILDQLEEVLKNQRQIPYYRVGGKDCIPKSGEFRAIRGYLRLAVNPFDHRAFMAISAAEGISTQRLWNLRSEANAHQQTLLSTYGKELPKEVEDLEPYLKEQDPAHDYQRAFMYLRAIAFYEGGQSTQDLVNMLAMHSLQDQLRGRGNDDKITLATAHSAKGLEWGSVFLVGLDSAHWPTKIAVREDNIDDERRLLYVAMTRAEERLWMVSGVPQEADAGPSPFLEEIA